MVGAQKALPTRLGKLKATAQTNALWYPGLGNSNVHPRHGRPRLRQSKL